LGTDATYKTLVWNLSQNVDRTTGGRWNVPWLGLACSSNGAWVFLECGLNGAWMLLEPECGPDHRWAVERSLIRACMFLKWGLSVPWMWLECCLSQNVDRMTSWWLNVPWMFPECSLNVPWMFPECSLNVPWMFPECSSNPPRNSLNPPI
jgi:hypothetical protein